MTTGASFGGSGIGSGSGSGSTTGSKYDVETRDNAYSRALPAVEQILAENPSIQVIIDLHREEVAEETKLVTDIQGLSLIHISIKMATSKGVYHKNNAARKVSRLSKAVNGMA